MPHYSKSEIVSGLFVAAAIVVFALVAFRIGAFDPFAALRPKPVLCVARFSDAKGLKDVGKVMVAGKEVGSIVSIRIVQAELTQREAEALVDLFGAESFPELKAGMSRQVVEVTFGIADSDLRLDQATSRVTIGKDGLFGEYYLALDPGYWMGEQQSLVLLRPAQPVAIAARDSAGFDEILAQLSPVVRQARSILKSIDQRLLTSQNLDALSATIESIEGATRDLRRLVKDDNPEGVQQFVVRPLNKLLTNADESIAALRERLLNETLTKAEKLLDEGSDTAERVKGVVNNVDEILTESRPNVKVLVDNLAAASKTLNEKLESLSSELQDGVRIAREMLTENRPELAETVRRLRRTMWEAEMAMRKIRTNPAYLIFGDSEQVLDERPVDESGLRRSGRARPYQQRDESDGGR